MNECLLSGPVPLTLGKKRMLDLLNTPAGLSQADSLIKSYLKYLSSVFPSSFSLKLPQFKFRWQSEYWALVLFKMGFTTISTINTSLKNERYRCKRWKIPFFSSNLVIHLYRILFFSKVQFLKIMILE